MRCTPYLILCLLLAAPLARAAAPGTKSPEVTVSVQPIEYPVSQAPAQTRFPYLKKNPKLAGKDKFITDAVVLENEFIKAVVLPEFGARLPRVTFKKPNRDLLWVHDVLEDDLPWAMGGSCFSFPYPEDGRHLDESAGRRIVKNPDGSVTVAMDMRFTQYAGEVRRYERFSALRQATFVTLRPGAAWIEYAARVDNPLPLRHGFRLWNVARFPRRAGAQVLFPVDGVTDRGAAAMVRWPEWDGVNHGVLGDWGASCFAVDNQGDWAGVYYPDADANHLVLRSRYTALGTRFHADPVNPDPNAPHAPREAMIEIGSGSNPHFDHPGHYLPPFGDYTMPLRFAMVTGIGRLDWTDGTVALAYDAPEGADDSRIRIVAFEIHAHVKVIARTREETVEVKGNLRPDVPLVVRLTKRIEPVILTIMESDGELAQVSLPWQPEPAPKETFDTLQAQVKARDWIAAELADWIRTDGLALPDAADLLTKDPASTKVDQAIQAARVLIRTEKPGSARWHLARRVLDTVVRRDPRNPHAAVSLATMMTIDAGGRPPADALELITKMGKFPSARYLMALQALGAQNLTGALTHLKACVAQAPHVAMGLADEAILGNDRLHPAATLTGEWPDLLRAVALLAIERTQPAIGAAESVLVSDPARPEALALLAEAYAKAERTDKARRALADAESLFQGNEQARKDYERLRREAKTGLWGGTPKP